VVYLSQNCKPRCGFASSVIILLLNLIVIILANPVSQLISISTGSISQTVAMTIIYIVSVIVIIIRLFVYYTNLLAIIQYYNKNGEKIDKSEITNVRVLGPIRKYTQVEISRTDAYKLGINPPVRNSGDLKGSETVTLIGPKGSIKKEDCCIQAIRHIHLTKEKL